MVENNENFVKTVDGVGKSSEIGKLLEIGKSLGIGKSLEIGKYSETFFTFA